MEIRNLQSFLRVAELGNFSRAAEELGYSQPAVTIQISQLEEELGVRLFDRINKTIRLTDQGRQFAEYAAQILSTIDEAKSAVVEGENVSGSLRIGVAESLASNILPDALTEFQRTCPDVETTIRTDVNPVMYEAFQNNELDIIYFMDTLIYRSDWIKVFERPEPVHFVVAADHPLAGKEHVPLERILDEPLMLTEKSASYCYELERELAKVGQELHPMLEAGNTDLLIHLLMEGGGISFLPEYAIERQVRGGSLAVVKCDEINIQMWSQLAYHKKKWMTPPMRIFLDIMARMEGDTSKWGKTGL